MLHLFIVPVTADDFVTYNIFLDFVTSHFLLPTSSRGASKFSRLSLHNSWIRKGACTGKCGGTTYTYIHTYVYYIAGNGQRKYASAKINNPDLINLIDWKEIIYQLDILTQQW
jgi:hypothetical protein